MTFDEICIATADNSRLPDETISMPDRLAWICLRSTYEDYSNARITLDEAKAIKARIRRQHMKDTSQYKMYQNALERSESQYKEAERAAIAYARSGNRSPEADVLFRIFYGDVLEKSSEHRS